MINLQNDTKCTVAIKDAAGNTIDHILTIGCLPYIFQNMIMWALISAGVVAVILIIISGIKFITSGGDAKQAESARKTLTFTLIGLVLIILSFAILGFIAQLTGVGCIKEFGFGQCNQAPATFFR